MKYLNFYKKRGWKENEVFNHFMNSIQNSIKNWEYFVDWNKVKRESSKFKDELNLLNGLLGQKDIKSEFIRLVKKYPKIIQVLPVLLAVREKELEIRKFSESKDLSCLNFDFRKKTSVDDGEAEKYYDFFSKSGLKDIFQNKNILSVPDYVFGVEVGLDSNGRKNRGGHLMEDLVEFLIKPYLEKSNYEYLKEANAKKIEETWGYKIKVKKSSRRFDFVIYDKNKKEITIIETNFFNGGGSKPKSVYSEFQKLFDELKSQKINFVWITDGKGTHKEKNPFEDAYLVNEYVFNLFMINQGILSEVL